MGIRAHRLKTAGKTVDIGSATEPTVGQVLVVTDTSGDRIVAGWGNPGSVTTTAVALTDNGGGTADGTVASMAPAVTITDSTGLSGTHDDILAATTIPTITATNPAAPTAYTAHAAGGVAVTSAAATDLDTTAAALATLRGEVATYETAISALVVDVAAILSVNTVMAQNISDLGQKIIELVTWQATVQNNIKELVTQYNQLRSDIAT